VLFLGGQGSNFSLFHILSSSPLQHSGTTVRVRDDKVLIDLMFDSNVAGSLHSWLLSGCDEVASRRSRHRLI